MRAAKTGRLIIFEGPDGVGKSTLARWFTERLLAKGEQAHLRSFPGIDEGTLGGLVYRVHHNPHDFGVRKMSATGLQTLHIAAHLDAIEREIKPAIYSGRTIVLDRYWWSTFVYASVGGVSGEVLNRMIDLEKEVWKPVLPNRAFLIERDTPLRPEPPDLWPRWMQTYKELAETEQTRYPVHRVANTETLTDVQRRIENIDEQ
jgi:thymidylate kinase